jgi:F0F1-type ATP synthase assembly protein I
MSHAIDPSGPPPKRRLFSRKPRAGKGPKKTGRMKQVAEVFKMTRRNDPSVVWFMLLAFVGIIAVGLLIGLLINNVITLMIIAIPLAFLAAIFILSRRAERAAFSQIEGRPGAAGAALSVLRRGWILQEQPIAVNPRTQDAVFRVIGRPGVILVSEGPSARVKQLIDGEKRKMARIIPNVPVHVIETGRDDRQVPLAKVPKAVQKLKKTLTKQEVHAVDKRLTALGTKLPIPKGVDPMRARPDRKAMRGR